MSPRSHSARVQTASTGTVRATPLDFYDWIDGQLHFTIDVCANEANRKHPRYFSEADNGLAQSWAGETFWCNPPYGKQAPHWLRKARDSSMEFRAMGALLLPARPGAEWWRALVLQFDGAAGKLREIRPARRGLSLLWYRYERLTVGVYFHDERLSFEEHDTGAPFDSALVFFAHPSRRPVKPSIVATLPARREWPMLVEDWP